MRKWIILMAVFLLILIAGPAQAIEISMTDNSPRYWDWMDVSFDGSPMHVGAGRFYTTIHDGEKEIDTFSYCVEIDEHFNWSPKSYEVTVGEFTEPRLKAAWLVNQYDPFTGDKKSLMDFDAQTIAMTLQLAIWETLYDGRFSRMDSGNGSLFDEMMGLAMPDDFISDGFFVAVIDGQDQLVAAPVPEPATMLLMGIGLLGLGVVGRKRLK